MFSFFSFLLFSKGTFLLHTLVRHSRTYRKKIIECSWDVVHFAIQVFF